MTFREIELGSEDFRRECELRHAVLRLPFGLNLDDEDLAPEKAQVHFGAFDVGGNLIACVIAAPLSPTEAKIRQMAVASEHQDKGHGRRLLQHLENHLAHRGILHLCLHARTAASGFYKKMGYRTAGPEFLELGILHVRMTKSLQGEIEESDV